MKAILCFILIILAITVQIADCVEQSNSNDGIILPKFFAMLGSADSNSVMSADCQGEAPYAEISCHFTQIVVSKMTDAQKKKDQDELADLDKMTGKDLKDFAKSMGGQEGLKKAESRVAIAATPEKKASMQDLIALMRESIEAKDKKAVKQVTQKFNEMRADTCTLNIHVFDVVFQRLTKTKWMSNPGPMGLCNVVRVTTLENTVEYPTLWKFMQVVASSDTGKMCGVLMNKPVVYSWDMPTQMTLGCKYLAFD